MATALSVEGAVKRIADSWEAAVETEFMTFESVAAELPLKQQPADLVRVYPQEDSRFARNRRGHLPKVES